jgi:ketosteroid isomerase-like protein
VSQENVAVVRKGYESLARGDLGATARFWAPEIEWHTNSDVPFEGIYRGVDEVRRAIEDWVGTFDEFTTVVEELIDTGEQVIACHRMRGKGKESGVVVEYLLVQVITLRRGKQVRIDDYPTRAEALAAVGLSEQDAGFTADARPSVAISSTTWRPGPIRASRSRT